jgi:hypothetical protein
MGHFLIAVEFGLSAEPRAYSVADQMKTVSALDGRYLAGICGFDGRATPWQTSCIGWGGAVAECLLGVAPNMPFPFEPQFLRQWFHVLKNRDQSAEDRILIHGYPRPFRSFKAAVRILTKQKQQLATLARLHADKVEPPPPPPPPPLPDTQMPERFPAKKADFVRLIIDPGGKSGDETFNKFVNCYFSGLFDLRLATTLFEQRIETRAGFEMLARDYLKWERDNPQPATPEGKEHKTL